MGTKRSAAAAHPGSLLVGDIGGTRTRLALYDPLGRRVLAQGVLPSRDHETFEEVLDIFLASTLAPRPSIAVLGLAAPVQGRTAALTNLPWRLDEARLERRFGLHAARLVNDLVVAARGCLHLPTRSIVPLTEARPSPRGQNVAVIAAGTGLGEARLIWDGGRHLALPTEGGHGDFAPRNALEMEIWQFLSNRYPDHVSYERVLSGDGLGGLYDFFATRTGREPRAVARRLAEGDRNEAISELGLARRHRPAARAVDLFASIYGAEAGNMALRELAFGGVYVVGNIGASLVLERSELFLQGFRAKGRFSAMLSAIPVAVVADPLVGLRGALAMARDLARAQPAKRAARVPAAPPRRASRA